MPEQGENMSRAERWAASVAEDMSWAAWERRQEEHWERLHQQLYWLPLYFFLWSIGLGVAIFVGAIALGISLSGPWRM